MDSETTPATDSPRPRGVPGEVADQLGSAARCLYLVRPSSGADTNALALETAQRIGARRPRTLLLNLEEGERTLDRRLGLEHAPGLTAAFRGEARMADVAIREAGRSFYYVPAGPGAASPGAVLSSAAMAHLVRRAREQRGTVLLHVAAAPDVTGRLRADVDGSILLGAVPRSEAPLSVPILARVTHPPVGRPVGREESPAAAAGGRAGRADRADAGSPEAPLGPGLVGVTPGKPRIGDFRFRWRHVIVIGGLALALGFFIAWLGANDMWQEWLNWSAEAGARMP